MSELETNVGTTVVVENEVVETPETEEATEEETIAE